MKHTLALLLCGLLCVGGIAPSIAEATTFIISTGHHHGRHHGHHHGYYYGHHHGRYYGHHHGHHHGRHGHRVWIPAHYNYANHHRYWVSGHWAFR